MERHPNDHKPIWRSPVDRRGWTTGPTACKECGREAIEVPCVNCGELLDESTVAHGYLGGAVHSTLVKR